MAGIIVTFLIAILGLTLLLVFSLRPDGASAAKGSTDNQIHLPVAGLSSAFFPPLDLLVGADDYRKLRAMPDLKPICKIFWRDRRRIVLLWSGELQKDVHMLWKFRRFLVRNGLPVTFREEASVAAIALLALLCLKVTQVTVFVFGPFALHRALRNAHFLVERLSVSGAAPLSRASATRKAEIERMWKQNILTMGVRSG